MKLRIEANGFHFYDRITGLHYLIDEIKPDTPLTLGPRTVSIAITNECNANCSFCHITKGNTYLDSKFLIEFCKKLDSIGTFDIALGGGEPLLHPQIIEICKSIWTQTKLGISLTTNGQLLTEDLINEIKGYLSFIRVSIDSIDEIQYKKIRSHDLKQVINNISYLNQKIPFGINMVISSETINGLAAMLNFAVNAGAEELLILPLIKNSQFALSNSEWKILENWINDNINKFPLRILEQARKKINVPVLFTEDDYYNDYLYLSADKELKKSSYVKRGKKLNCQMIDKQLINFK